MAAAAVRRRWGSNSSGADGSDFVPVGGTLSEVADIDTKEAEKLLAGVSLTAMCDIDNPLYGPTGAACVFAPQKGADEATVVFLDGQLRALAGVIEAKLGRSVAALPGAGAAGGLGAGMVAFLGAQLRPGIEAVLDLVRFDARLDGCDLVLTGEGRLDTQSVRGKVISGVAKHAKEKSVPVVAIVGGVLPEVEDLCDDPALGLTAVFSINRQAMDFAQSPLRQPGKLHLHPQQHPPPAAGSGNKIKMPPRHFGAEALRSRTQAAMAADSAWSFLRTTIRQMRCTSAVKIQLMG